MMSEDQTTTSRKRSAETVSGGGGVVSFAPSDRTAKKLRPNGDDDASDIRSMEIALQSAIGGDALPIRQLLSIIAGYTKEFIPTIKVLWKFRHCEPNRLCDISTPTVGSRIISADDSERFWRFNLDTGQTQLLCGPFLRGRSGFVIGSPQQSRFTSPVAAVRDPLRPNAFYLAEQSSIRYYDESRAVGDPDYDMVKLVAGSGPEHGEGSLDGIGSEARFDQITDLVITSDGKTLWVLDQMTLRRVVISTQAVTTHDVDDGSNGLGPVTERKTGYSAVDGRWGGTDTS